VATAGLLGFLYSWFGSLLDWPGASTSGCVALALAGLLFGLIDVASLTAYTCCRQVSRSTGLRPWIIASLVIAVPRNLGCFSSGVLVLLWGLPPGGSGPRIAVGVAGTLFLVQWVLQALFLRAVARGQCCVRLMRHLHSWLFLLAATIVMGAILLASWPVASSAPASSAEWISAYYLFVLGLLSAVLTWACFAWYVLITHWLRLAIPG
jgi:hypothetical protein